MPNGSALWLADYDARKAREIARGNTGKGWLLSNKCLICYGSFNRQTCPGPGGYLPGGSQNPHGSKLTMVPNDFVVPDHLTDAGRLKEATDYKVWLPHPNNRREISPDSEADEEEVTEDVTAANAKRRLQ